MNVLFSIIYEDSELLVINKPAGLVCHPTKTGAHSSLIGRVRLYLPPDIHPHLINRLDRETSGLVLVARDDTTARALRRLWENRQVEKIYSAIVKGHVRADAGVIDAPLGKDEQSSCAIKDCVRSDGAPAQTRFEVRARFSRAPLPLRGEESGNFSLLKVTPLTGRKHQIRIHLAHIGHPIVGDKLYGGREELYLAFVQGKLSERERAELIFENHALHAEEIRFTWKGQERVFKAEPEPWFSAFTK